MNPIRKIGASSSAGAWPANPTEWRGDLETGRDFFAPCPVRVSTGIMSVEVERATMPCNVCGAAVSELRRGRCWGCYTRWVDSRPVGRGASCTVCHEKRRNQLKLVELKGRSLPFCHGCAAQVLRLRRRPRDRRGAPPRSCAASAATATAATARRSTSASSRASAAWASAAARRATRYADTDPSHAPVRVRGRRHRAGRDRHGRGRADAGPRPARRRRRPSRLTSANSRSAKRELDLPGLAFLDGADRLALADAGVTPRPRPRRRRGAAGACRPAPRRAAASRP